jgi:hypothetical protein
MAQISGILSALYALSSVLCGMLLISNHQDRVESFGSAGVSFQLVKFSCLTCSQVSYFEQVKSRGTGTTRPLAVILSLPLSLMLCGMIWFIFAIISCAYSTGLQGISHQYSVTARSLSLIFLCALCLAGFAAVRFFHGIWRAPTVAERQLSQTQPTAVDMVTGQGGNPLMQLSGDQHLGATSYANPMQEGQFLSNLKGRSLRHMLR